MTFRGDIGRVRELAERIGDLERVPSRVAERVPGELEAALDAEFAAGVDPYGKPWAPLSPKTKRSGTPLDASGRMRAGVHAAPKTDGVAITVPHPGEIHQTGWSGPRGSGPARPIVPDRDVLPTEWSAILGAATEDEIRKAVGK